MTTRPDLTRLLTPQSIAVIDASTNLTSISGQPLRLMLDAGYAGKLVPVNPRRAEVQGLKAYASAVDIPEPCDVALVALSAAQVPQAMGHRHTRRATRPQRNRAGCHRRTA